MFTLLQKVNSHEPLSKGDANKIIKKNPGIYGGLFYVYYFIYCALGHLPFEVV